MQTFVPFESNFNQCAFVLDDNRLNKQRSECQIILKTLLGLYDIETGKGWPHHPATRMWLGYEPALLGYSIAIALEWETRGHADTTLEWFVNLADDKGFDIENYEMPHWWGGGIHASHRSNLMEKNPEYYLRWWTDKPGMNYVWPSGKERLTPRIPLKSELWAWIKTGEGTTIGDGADYFGITPLEFIRIRDQKNTDRKGA